MDRDKRRQPASSSTVSIGTRYLTELKPEPISRPRPGCDRHTTANTCPSQNRTAHRGRDRSYRDMRRVQLPGTRKEVTQCRHRTACSVVSQFIEPAWIGKEVDAALDFYAPDFIHQNPAMKGMLLGPDGIRDLLLGSTLPSPMPTDRIRRRRVGDGRDGSACSFVARHKPGTTRSDACHVRTATAAGAIFCRVVDGPNRRAMGHRRRPRRGHATARTLARRLRVGSAAIQRSRFVR